MSLVNVPAVLFLDEPTLGLNISARRALGLRPPDR